MSNTQLPQEVRKGFSGNIGDKVLTTLNLSAMAFIILLNFLSLWAQEKRYEEILFYVGKSSTVVIDNETDVLKRLAMIDDRIVRLSLDLSRIEKNLLDTSSMKTIIAQDGAIVTTTQGGTSTIVSGGSTSTTSSTSSSSTTQCLPPVSCKR